MATTQNNILPKIVAIIYKGKGGIEYTAEVGKNEIEHIIQTNDENGVYQIHKPDGYAKVYHPIMVIYKNDEK